MLEKKQKSDQVSCDLTKRKQCCLSDEAVTETNFECSSSYHFLGSGFLSFFATFPKSC